MECVLHYFRSMKFSQLGSVAGLSFLLSAGAAGQSFNIDLDISAGGEVVGQGVPSSTFGGAANQPGLWNRLGAASHTQAFPLLDLSGNATTATVRWNVSGGGRGSGMGNNTGDYRLLLNDRTLISVPTTYHFENLLPGRYQVYTYGIDPSREYLPLKVEVPGAASPIQYAGQGPMPGNRFELGVTHCIHELGVPGDSFQMTLSGLSINPPDPSVNGFQLVYTPVPEVGTMVSLLVGAALLSRKRK